MLANIFNVGEFVSITLFDVGATERDLVGSVLAVVIRQKFITHFLIFDKTCVQIN